ncbi:MAG: purine-nucleoside phosphorylase [Lachnospiraceae bacterium]|jgi:purine-nucleoside phosphorylase|nr:purine-nucleoside phosphorylase [Lachnospiraceae bacterium]MCI1727417.1 purine-nucleoside phosphorylase [Lachnospiraceae bacterium]
MANIPTPHIRAKKNDFAKTVLMPGDPLRAKYIAENYLKDAKLVTDVRNVLGYTGTYNGKKISVMASGMGMPSIGIYSYELYQFYGVENIVRIGSAGSIRKDVQLKDIVLAEGASTTSSWQDQFHLYGTFAPIASWNLLYKAVKASEKLKTKVVVGNVLSEDVFYSEDPENVRKWQNLGIICLEMESAALYMNAAKLGKNALAMFSISDEILTGKCLSSKDREVGFGKMMELALELA